MNTHNMKVGGFTRVLSLLLASLLLMSTAACSSGENADSPTTSASETTQGSVETEETNILDTLDFNGADFRIHMSATDISSDDYMHGFEEQSGDVVFDTVYERNLTVQEELGVNFVYTDTNIDFQKVAETVRTMVFAGLDEYELIVNDQRGLSTASIEHLLINAYDCEYFDFEKDCWWNEYMDNLSMTNENLYLLVGDYFLDVLRKSHVLYYNRDLYETLKGDPDALYQTVVDGDWTYDEFSKHITSAYMDLDGDDTYSPDDQYGMIIGGIGGSIFPFSYGTDIRFISRNEDGIPYLDMDTDRMTTLYEKIYSVFYNVGTRTKYQENGTDLHNKFISGSSLFISGAFIGDFDVFREMENDIGLVPYPKLDESSEDYRTVIHDTAEIGAIPSTCQNTDLASAVIQALCEETHEVLLPAYYETALKIKYVRDDYSAQMIDFVHDNITDLFALVYGGAWANDIFTWTFLEPLQGGKDSCVSSYTKREEAAIAGMEDMAAQYLGN